MKPLKKKRRICGLNVFVQKQLRGCGVRVGSAEWREKLKTAHNIWNSMSPEDRAPFDVAAGDQQEASSCLAKTPLSQDVSSIAGSSILCLIITLTVRFDDLRSNRIVVLYYFLAGPVYFM